MARRLRICEESVFELFNLAEYDTIQAYLGMEKTNVRHIKNKDICMYITQATEKYLKGYIKEKNKTAYHNHDLKELFEDVCEIDKNFKLFEKNCENINDYKKLRYESRFKFEDEEIMDLFKDLDKIISYGPILKIRNDFSKNKDYFKSDGLKLKDIMECIKYHKFDNSYLKDKFVETNLDVIDVLRFPNEISNIDMLTKLRYIDKNNNIVHVLERKRNNNVNGFVVESWQFKNNFTKDQAFKFENDWDNEDKRKEILK
jgi:HEPN domain-containing protein